MADDQAKLQAAAQEYQKIQDGDVITQANISERTELQSAVSARQKLEAQQHENKGVQNEFKNAKEDETIYKMVGPVLLKQDRDEALSTVEGRLDYIDKELKRVEDQIKGIQKRSEDKRQQILQLQTAAQQQGGAQGS